MKCKKIILPLFLSFLLFIMSLTSNICKIEGHAEGITTPSGHPDFSQADSTSVIEDIDWRKLASTAFKLKGIISPSMVGTAAGFIEYDLNNNNSLQAHPTIGIRNNADGSITYDIDKDIRQEIFNYINSTYVESAPLTYSVCKVHTYNMVNVQWFPTYALYQTFKSWASKQDGYILTNPWYGNGAVQGIRAVVIPKTNDINFVGSTNSGVFSNVALYIGWSTSTTPWTLTSNYKQYQIANNGTITEINNVGSLASTVGNTTNINDGNTSRMTIWTNLEKDETVFVFNSLNALKAYNSGSPQGYYLRSDWSNTVADDNLISSGELDSYGNAYSEVTNNIVSGMSAEQVIQLVDTILKNTNGGFGGSGSSDSTLDLGFLGKIGSIIGKVVTGIGDLITGILEGIANALIGEDGDGGILGLVTNVLTSLTELISEDFGEFINGLFSFMPSEIRTILVAGFTISVFLGVLRLIRK